MIDMKHTFLVASLLLMLTACGGNSSKEVMTDCKVIKVDISEVRPLDLTEFVKRITFTPLETNDSSLIGEVHSVQVRNGKTFINSHREEVIAFDEQGKFLFNTNVRKGVGPQDYYYAMSTNVDSKENITFYHFHHHQMKEDDNLRNRRNMDDTRGRDSTLSAMRFRDHYRLDDDLFLVRDYCHTHFYSLSQKKAIKTLFNGDNGLNYCSIPLLEQDGTCYFSKYYPGDTLFCVNKEKLTLEPVVIYDFGGESFNLNDLAVDMGIAYLNSVIMTTKKIFVGDKLHYADKDLCFFMQNGEGGFLAYTSGDLQAVYKNPNLFPYAVEGNKLYQLVMPDKIKDYIHPTLVDEESLKRIENLLEDDNQVLVCYELR